MGKSETKIKCQDRLAKKARQFMTEPVEATMDPYQFMNPRGSTEHFHIFRMDRLRHQNWTPSQLISAI